MDYRLNTSDESEDMDYLRVRLEYENAPGEWVQFHEVEITNMILDGDYYAYSVKASALAAKRTEGNRHVRVSYIYQEGNIFQSEDETDERGGSW